MTQPDKNANVDRVEALRKAIIDEMQKQYGKQIEDMQATLNDSLSHLSYTKEELESKYKKLSHHVNKNASLSTKTTEPGTKTDLPSKDVQLTIGEVLQRESGEPLELNGSER